MLLPKRQPILPPSRRRFTPTPLDIDRLLFWGWTALLCWAPIPLGSNRTWAWVTLEVGVFLLLAAWCVAYLFRKVVVPVAFARARGILCLLLLWLVYQAVYLIPLPASVIAAISPEIAAMHALTSGFTGSALRPLALDLYAAQVSWLKSLAYVCAFVLTLLLVNSRERARQFAFSLVLFALLLSVYGIMLHLNNLQQVWFGTVLLHGVRTVATYANPNHFAGFLEMTLAIGIGLLVADLRDRKAETWKQFLRNLLEWVFSPKMRLRLMLCVMVIALVSTHSRMGNTAFFASLMIAGVIGLLLSRHAVRGAVVLFVSLIVIDLFIVGAWFGVEKLANRLEQTALVKSVTDTTSGPVATEESVEKRLDASKYGLEMIKDYPLIGVGPGAWPVAFPRYRGQDLATFFYDAHNDFVQFAAESGLIGFVLLGVIVLWSYLVAIRAHYKRRDPVMRGLSFASIMGILSIMIHSSVDFNLQIPANTMYFMVLLALGWIALYLDRRPAKAEQVDPGTSDSLIHQRAKIS